MNRSPLGRGFLRKEQREAKDVRRKKEKKKAEKDNSRSCLYTAG